MGKTNIKKTFITFTLIVCLFFVIYMGEVFLKKRGDTLIMIGKEPPYTVEQIETMMKYHGALVAKFENDRWLFLKDGEWIAIENGNALEFVVRSIDTNSHSL